MKWSTEAKVGAFALAGILLFAGILIELSSLVIFGKSGFHVTGYFKEAEGIEPGNPIHCVFITMPRCRRMRTSPSRPAVSWADAS